MNKSQFLDKITPIINMSNHENGEVCMELIQCMYDKERIGEDQYFSLSGVKQHFLALKKKLNIK